MPSRVQLFEHVSSDPNGRAAVWIDGSVRSPYTVRPQLFGKFCEHLRTNIYHGMEAQILLNPTFGRWSFVASGSGVSRPDGGVALEADKARIKVEDL